MGDDWADLSPNGRYAVLCRAALRQARTDVALSHISAATSTAPRCGTSDLTQDAPDATDGPPGGSREAGIVHHRATLGRRLVVAPRRCPDHERRSRPPLELTTRTGRRARASSRSTTCCTASSRRLPSCSEAAMDAMTAGHGQLTTGLVLRAARTDDRSQRRLRRGRGTSSSGTGIPGPSPKYEVRDAHGREIAHRRLRRGRRWVCSSSSTGRIKYEQHRRPGRALDGLRDAREGREAQICVAEGLDVHPPHLGRPPASRVTGSPGSARPSIAARTSA